MGKQTITSDKLTLSQRQLAEHITAHCKNELNRISPSCTSPIIAIRQIARGAIEKYMADHPNTTENWARDDFLIVTRFIRDEFFHWGK